MVVAGMQKPVPKRECSVSLVLLFFCEKCHGYFNPDIPETAAYNDGYFHNVYKTFRLYAGKN
jgi:hypothetical protein